VSGGAVTLTNVGTVSNSNISSTGASNVVLQSTGSISNSNIIAGGSVTMQSTTSGISDSTVVAEGAGGIIVQSNAGISNSVVVTTSGTAPITVQGGTLSGSTLVTKGAFTVQSSAGSITNTNVFSGSTIIQKGAGDIAGGVLYSEGNTAIQGTGGGSQAVGTGGNPTLLLAGGDMLFQHNNGNTSFSGLVFANGRIVYQANGTFDVNGAIVANSTSQGSVFQGGGNAQITFRDDILSLLSNNLGGKVKPPACGGGGAKAPYISATKVTVY
jgi:fibronectin-binding autotransporter adhesin